MQKNLVEISRHFGGLPGLQPAMEHTLAETRRMQSVLFKCFDLTWEEGAMHATITAWSCRSPL